MSWGVLHQALDPLEAEDLATLEDIHLDAFGVPEDFDCFGHLGGSTDVFAATQRQ